MTSICSFITCISARMGGGAVSVRKGMLKFRRSSLLGSLLPSGLSGPLRSKLSPWFSSWTLCPASLWRSCFSRSWFYFVRRSIVVARVWTCLSSAVDLSGSSSWTLLVMAIERVSTMQLLCSGSDNGLNCHRFPTDGANWWGHKSHQWEARSLRSNKSPTQKKKTRIPCRRHRCGAGQIPSESQVRNILATLKC